MPTRTTWGRAGWGRTPSSLRRKAAPSFLYRRASAVDTGTFGDIHFSRTDDSDSSSQSEIEAWVDAPPSAADEA